MNGQINKSQSSRNGKQDKKNTIYKMVDDQTHNFMSNNNNTKSIVSFSSRVQKDDSDAVSKGFDPYKRHREYNFDVNNDPAKYLTLKTIKRKKFISNIVKQLAQNGNVDQTKDNLDKALMDTKFKVTEETYAKMTRIE